MTEETAPAIPDKLETIVTVREVLTPRTCHAALPNGKIIFGFTSKEVPDLPLAEGARVRVQMNVADFSRGEILAMEDQKPRAQGWHLPKCPG